MNPNKRGNNQYWSQYGQFMLMALPYADEVIVEAHGCTLHDADGKTLLDLASGMFCSVLGHDHPEFIARLSRQMCNVLHTGSQFLNPAVFEAGAKLAEIAPGNLRKSIFLSTGTEANEFAFRIAKAYTGRTGIVGLSRGYYGTSLATKSCSSISSSRSKDSLPNVAESFAIPITPQCASCFTQNALCQLPCLDAVESWIGDWSNVAAIIVEPLLSAGGMLSPPPGYLQRLKELAQENGALLIADEAQTGFGRTGKWFDVEYHGVVPDILTISKAAGNGFPVSAVITTDAIADRITRRGLWHLASHQSDPLGAAAVSAVIDILREEDLLQKATDDGAYFMDQLRDLSNRQPAIQNIRGRGLMIGFDIQLTDREESLRASHAFMYACRRYGVHLTYGYESTNIRILPPLVITRSEIDHAIDVFERSLADVLKQDLTKKLAPANPYTRRLIEDRPLRRMMTQLWRSSPEEVVTKGKKVIRNQFR